MIKRLLIIATVAAALIALIVYSQYRPKLDRVSGFIEAHEIRVGSRVGGRVHAVNVEEGDHVEQGQVLVELEPYDLLERESEAEFQLAASQAEYDRLSAGLRAEEVAQAKAQYDELKASLDLILAGPRQQEIEASRGRQKAADADYKLAERIYQMRLALYKENAVTDEELDEAKEQRNSARAILDVRMNELEQLELGARDEEKREARAKVDRAEQAWQLAKKGYRKEEIARAKATRDAAQAALDVIRQQEKELTIVSPIDGVIEALDLQQGDLVAASAPVLSIMDDSNLWVRTYVPQNRVGIRTGEKLWVTVDSFPGERFSGEVTFVSRQAEFTPNNVQTPEERAKQVFRVKVTLQEGLDKIRPGMTSDVWLQPVGDAP